jgi:HSP20 family molecular chaperone IbpA
MTNLARYTASDIPSLMEQITRNSIGIDQYLDRVFAQTTTNYPPYNLIQVNNLESRLEIALAGFKKEEVHAYTEYGKLFVEGEKQDKDEDGTFIHKGMAQRNFKRSWSLSDDTEVSNVTFEDGLLTIRLKKIVPDHYQRKEYI